MTGEPGDDEQQDVIEAEKLEEDQTPLEAEEVDEPQPAPEAEAAQTTPKVKRGLQADEEPLMPERDIMEAFSKNSRPLAMMFAFFIVAQLFGMAVTTLFDDAGVRAIEEEDQDKASYAIFYFIFILAFTGVVLWLATRHPKGIRYIFLGAVGMTLFYIFVPFIWYITDNSLTTTSWSLAMAISLVYALVRFPEWYIVDTTGLIMAGGVAAIFGISFGIGPALILMVAMAVYDAWAVYHTKHMVALADSVMEQKVPILLVAPKTKDYSFLTQGSLQEQLDKGEEREAMFMGLGDLVIPGMLIVGARYHLGWGVAFAALFGALVGLTILMSYVLKGKPQAGLPLLNGGTIGGYIIGVLIFGSGWGISWQL